MKEYQYYIFDFDMTLCDTTKGSELAYKKAFDYFGFEFKEEYVRQFLGEPLKTSFDRHNNTRVNFDDFELYFNACSDELIPPNTYYFADAKQLIDTLKNLKKTLAIVTNKNRSTLALILKRFSLENDFQQIISIEDIRKISNLAEKGDGIIECLKRLNISAKKESVYIGDSQNDMIAAKKAGIDCFLVSRNSETHVECGALNSLTDLSIPYTNTKQHKIDSKLHDIIHPYYCPNPQDQDDFKKLGISKYLLKKVISTNGKYKRRAVNEEMIADMERKISASINKQQPIFFSVPFGAYKGWQTDSNGEPDWAEVFNLNYFYLYASEIAEYYEHGVQFTYTYQDRIMPVVSNLSRDVCSRYIQKFNELTKLFSSYNPRITFTTLAIDSLYPNIDEYWQEFLDNVFENTIEIIDNLYMSNLDSLPYKNYIDLLLQNKVDEANTLVQSRPSPIFAKLQSGMNNYNFMGYDNKSSRAEDDVKTKIIRSIVSALMIDAVDSLKLRRMYNKFSDNIQIVFDKTPTLSLLLGSCQGSIKHFWTGTGAMIYKEEKEDFKPTVLSQKEWITLQEGKKIKLNSESVENSYIVEKISVHTELSSISTNYNSINIIQKIL